MLATVAEHEGSVVCNRSAFGVGGKVRFGGKIVVLRRAESSSVRCYGVSVISVFLWMQLVYSVCGWGIEPMPMAWGGFSPVAEGLTE